MSVATVYCGYDKYAFQTSDLKVMGDLLSLIPVSTLKRMSPNLDNLAIYVNYNKHKYIIPLEAAAFDYAPFLEMTFIESRVDNCCNCHHKLQKGMGTFMSENRRFCSGACTFRFHEPKLSLLDAVKEKQKVVTSENEPDKKRAAPRKKVTVNKQPLITDSFLDQPPPLMLPSPIRKGVAKSRLLLEEDE